MPHIHTASSIGIISSSKQYEKTTLGQFKAARSADVRQVLQKSRLENNGIVIFSGVQMPLLWYCYNFK